MCMYIYIYIYTYIYTYIYIYIHIHMQEFPIRHDLPMVSRDNPTEMAASLAQRYTSKGV